MRQGGCEQGGCERVEFRVLVRVAVRWWRDDKKPGYGKVKRPRPPKEYMCVCSLKR